MTGSAGQVMHIVLFKWTDGASRDAIESAVQGLRGLRDQIPGILDLSCGANFSDRGQGFTHGLVVRFIDRASLEAYGPHPAHQRVVQDRINPIRADVIAFDYEI